MRPPVPTFVVVGGTGLDHAPLRRLLAAEGWEEAGTGEAGRAVDYAHIEQLGERFVKASYSIVCRVKNIISSEKTVITDKERLYENMRARFPEVCSRHMAETTNLEGARGPAPGQVLIVRPVGVGACSGKDIHIVDSPRGLRAARAALRRYPSAIVSTYIDSPLLWEGRKFHLRMYLLVQAGPAVPFSHELWSRGKILTAAKPYELARFDDPDIHDTHARSTPRDLWWPEDFPAPDGCEAVFAQMREIMDAAAAIVRPHARPYPESKNAFEVFGVDFLVRDDLRVFLMEINDRVGYMSSAAPPDFDPRKGPWTEEYSCFSADYFRWIYDRAIRPVMDAAERPPADGGGEGEGGESGPRGEHPRVTAIEKIKGINSLLRVLNEDRPLALRAGPVALRTVFPSRIAAGLLAL